MTDTGLVARAVVISVLRSHGVQVTDASSTHGNNKYILESKGGDIEVQALAPDVKKRLLHYFKRKYGIPIHVFYNTTVVPQQEEVTPGEEPTIQ